MLVYELVHKPTFTNQLLALPPKEIPHILEKVESLRFSPALDGTKTKKKLHGYKNDIYRLRVGDYRVLYAFSKDWVALLGVDARKDVYKGDKLIAEGLTVTVPLGQRSDDLLELLPVPDWPLPISALLTVPTDDAVPVEELVGPVTASHDGPSIDLPTSVQMPTPLPRALDEAFLIQIRVPAQHISALAECTTLERLIEAEIPEEIRTQVWDAVMLPDYDKVVEQPSFRVDSVDDYRRFLDGDLVTFLLRLDPDQERFVNWGIGGSGPTLLKGSPGTGKSIVAIYRVRSLIKALRREGVAEPRILFTSYTHALVESSRQLLRRLLGDDADLVDVRTADSLVSEIIKSVGESSRSADTSLVRGFTHRARSGLERGTVEERDLVRSIANLTTVYLDTEIDRVIVGRDHADMSAYLEDRRAGRQVRLTAVQRTAIWRIYEAREAMMAARRERGFAQNRRRAAQLVRDGRWIRRYDGVIVDEAQDLDPVVIRLLVDSCRSSDRLLLTADSNQSIYGSGFRWADVHADLRFRGRTGVLRRNYRSTSEISAAATSYLTGAELDEADEAAPKAIEHVRSGPVPMVRPVVDNGNELFHLHRFLRQATRTHRVGFGSCAVLVPTAAIGIAIQTRLRGVGLRAEFMPGRTIDLEKPVVKIITLQSSKGLEFPVVAVAGLLHASPLHTASDSPVEETAEALQVARRVLYVAMTRAMHALVVLTPSERPSGLYTGFDERYWIHHQLQRTAPVSTAI